MSRKKKSAYLRLEESRNCRLWIDTLVKGIGVAVATATLINNNPELRLKCETAKYEVKKKTNNLVSKFRK